MAYQTITWKPEDIVELTNTTSENFLLELASGLMRLDAGRTIRATGCALDLPQVATLVDAGKISVQKFRPRKGHYKKPPMREPR